MSDEQRCVFSVDVEDWFHILALPEAPDIAAWDRLPGHVARNFRKMLSIFSEAGVQVTCFFLGWVAERYPDLVREAAAAGHEVASHGYAHMLTFEMTPETFHQDVRRTRELLEDITGKSVSGYRSPGFSATADTPWFFDELTRAGYKYDSSVFPASRQHGGMEGGDLAPHVVRTAQGPIIEFPITIAHILGRPMCFFGGGYLRLFPYPLIKRMSNRVLGENRPVVFYVHPREIEPGHPRLPMSAVRRFKSYVNLDTTEHKIRKILGDFRVTTFERFIADNHIGTDATA
jgi:polysaccharide deacetylase family protein (PEP-CTERM system associated)